jgi:biopolymer transport protein ExbB/TolQ
MGLLQSLVPVIAASEGGLFTTLARRWEEGGFGMYPIAACGVFVVAIAVDRFMVLFGKASIDKEAFLRGLKKHIYAGDLDKAISYVAGQKRTPLTQVIKAGLINVPKGPEEVQAAMDEAMLREAPRIEKRTAYLAMFSNAAMLFGLLGTIYGLIEVFGGVGAANPADKAALLSAGIAHVMNCTGFGLIVAIIALLTWSVLQGRTQHMMDDINESSVGLLNLIVAHKDKMKIPAHIDAGGEE